MADPNAITMYAASVPIFSGTLKNLASFAAKGEANAKERGIDPQVFLGGRLAADMLPFSRQIQIATDNAKGAACRLAGRDVPSWADEEKTFEELQARIAKARDLLKGCKPEEFAGAETRPIVLKLRSGEVKFDGIGYLSRFALPNFFFHVTTAYGILRHLGVPLGKPDFLGNR
jgi:hypothetical protein